MDKSSKKKFIITGGTVSAACIVIIAVMLAAGSSSGRKAAELLEAGDRYLSELNYEQAVASYQAVIEIDPKNAEAYLGMAEAYAGLGEYESALAVLRQGYEATDDERFEERIATLEAFGSGAEDTGGGNEAEAGGNGAGDVFAEGAVSAEEAEAAYVKVQNLLRNWGCSFYSSGCGMLLTWEERHAVYDPLAEGMEEYLRLYPEESDAYDCLARLYLELGDTEACLRVRKAGYEITGWQYLNPEDTEHVTPYGQSASNDEYQYEYDEYGRLVHEVHTVTGSEYYLEYDDTGRLVCLRHNNVGDTGTRNIISTWIYDGNGTATIRTTYEGTDESWVRSCTEGSEGNYFVTVYDEYGRETVYEYYLDNNLRSKTVTEYDENGENISEVRTEY